MGLKDFFYHSDILSCITFHIISKQNTIFIDWTYFGDYVMTTLILWKDLSIKDWQITFCKFEAEGRKNAKVFLDHKNNFLSQKVRIIFRNNCILFPKLFWPAVKKRPRICKSFEFTRTIYIFKQWKASTNFEIKLFFNLFLAVSQILLIRDMVVERCNRWFGCQTIHPTPKFTSMNLLQMSCVIT